MGNFITNNILIQTINFKVIFNVFLVSGAATTGILIAKQVAGMFLSFIQYKWTINYDMRATEIKELNNKMHDRLVELEEAINTDLKPENYEKIKTRLRYNSARLCKYDKTILADANELLHMLSGDSSIQKVILLDKKDDARRLIEQIRAKIDKLWFR